MEELNFAGCSVSISPIIDRTQSQRENERLAIAGMLELKAGKPVKILHHPNGAPYPDGLPLHISISHSRHLAALLTGDRPGIGIDIEENRATQLSRVASRVLNADELEFYSPRPMGLLTGWTLKEAAYKAAGIDTADLREIKLPIKDNSREIIFRDKKLYIIFSGEIEVGGIKAMLSVVGSY